MRAARAEELDLGDLGNPDAVNVLRWQSLWVALVEHPWSTLAVVPVGHASLAQDVVMRLVEIARAMHQQAFPVRQAVDQTVENRRCLMPTPSPLVFPDAALVARSADAVVLVVSLGNDAVEQVQRVRDMVGVKKILGCVVANRVLNKVVAHGVAHERGGGNLQPAPGAGALVGGPEPAAAARQHV